MYELYLTDTGGRGSFAEVWIDRDAGLVKKIYKLNSTSISNRPPFHNNEEDMTRLFQNEIFWSTKLRSDLVLETYEHGKLPDQFGYYLIQEYAGPDLLHYFSPDTRLAHVIPDASDQIEEMFAFWQSHNMYKFNNAMANLVLSKGRIKAFDFKYAKVRLPEDRHSEVRSIDEWISKIDPSIKDRLLKYL